MPRSPSKDWGNIVLPLSVCLSVRPSVCPSATNLTCKLNISLLLQNIPYIWHECYFQQYEPNEGHGSKVKVI